MLATEVLYDVGGVGLRLRDLYARLQSANALERIRRGARRVQRQRNPQLRFDSRVFELRRHHADDFARGVIQDERVAYDLRITAEAPLPESVTNHTNAILAGRVLAFAKGATERRVDAEDFEVIGADVGDRQAFRLTLAGQVDAAAVEHGQRFK